MAAELLRPAKSSWVETVRSGAAASPRSRGGAVSHPLADAFDGGRRRSCDGCFWFTSGLLTAKRFPLTFPTLATARFYVHVALPDGRSSTALPLLFGPCAAFHFDPPSP